MSVGFVRPSVSDLMFHLYERSLHPELFDIRREGSVSQPDYTARIRICDTGHTVSFQTRNTTLTELVARRGQTPSLPATQFGNVVKTAMHAVA